jgi:hypothetical protein
MAVDFVPVEDMSPEDALKDYEANADPELLRDIEKMVSLGTKDMLRLLAFMHLHLLFTVKDILEQIGTEDQLLVNAVAPDKKDMN